MKLNPIKSNMTEIELWNGLCVLFSYKTPVACFKPGVGPIVTEQHWSKTTTRHINFWLREIVGSAQTAKTAPKSPQDFFDNLLENNF